VTDVRKGQGDVELTREQFEQRLRARCSDPEFASVSGAIGAIADVAWRACDEDDKSPSTRNAGPGFADPDFELPVEWLDAREAIQVGFHDEVRHAGRPPVEGIRLQRTGRWPRADRDVRPPRPK
jgi:hypothetical protein